MSNTTRLVFDDTLEDQNAPSSPAIAYTSLVHAGFLAAADQMVFHLRVSQYANLPDVFLRVEMCADGRQWRAKTATTIALTFVASASVATFVGAETWPPRPNLQFARVRIEMSYKGNPYRASVQLFVTARSRRKRSDKAAAPSRRPELAASTLRELSSLLAEESARGPGAHERATARLSAGARGEMASLFRQAREIRGDTRHDLAAALLAGAMGPTDCNGDCGEKG